ncbi:MAG TPA: hypothetical protein VGG06_01190 [Thermoanaerobaculia bacterium]|jgi:hypothetical protein
MSKTAVYSWRLSPDLKVAIEEAAKERRESTAVLLERIVRDWLVHSSSREDQAEQRRLHVAAARVFGSIDGGDPDLSVNASRILRERLARRHERES